ncbi:MAG: acetylxylan esterase [Chthoniobacter sp.]|uniref:alpha/beta hydrolase family protein n=1 Tax=Chthoniobacter sp. TaxID=2510640 RepID=UPI0032A3F452
MNTRSLPILTAVAVFALRTTMAAPPAENPPVAPPPIPADPTGPMWDMAALGQAPKTYPADPIRADGLKGIFFEGLPYHGKPTRVFAWLGLPKVEQGKKVPGIVLVHGGGGTAFEKWTQLWVDRGYAAIAIDTSGAIPLHTIDGKKWQHHDAGGPPGWGGWDQMNEAREDQWTYHAVADGVLADSLLRSLPQVDPERIGVTGISWGGYLTSMLAGVDQRFKFAVPVYGCGFTNEHGFAHNVEALGPEGAARWMRWWDPSSYLAHATMPMLWVDGTNDFAYTMNAWQKSYRLPKSPHTLCLRPRMSHGHESGWAPKEIATFADSIVNGGDPLPKITGQSRKGRAVTATFTSVHPIAKAELHFTKATGPWQQRLWEVAPATFADGKVTAELPEGTKVYYFNLTDDRECIASTEHEEVDL